MSLSTDYFVDLLREHTYSFNGVYSCACGVGNWPAYDGFRRHLAGEIAHEVALYSDTGVDRRSARASGEQPGASDGD